MSVVERERIKSTYSYFGTLADLEREVESAFEGVSFSFETPAPIDARPSWIEVTSYADVSELSIISAAISSVAAYVTTSTTLAVQGAWPQYSYAISIAPYLTSVSSISQPSFEFLIPTGVKSRADFSHDYDNFARECLDDLMSWLGASLSELASALGLSRSTIYAWSTRGSRPRSATTQQLYRVHAMVAFITRSVGLDTARAWLHAGDPSPRNRILSAASDRSALTKLAAEFQEMFAPAPAPPVDPASTVHIGKELIGLLNAVPEGW